MESEVAVVEMVICPSCNQLCHSDNLHKCDVCGGEYCGKLSHGCTALCLCSINGVESDLYDEDLAMEEMGMPTGLSEVEKLTLKANRAEEISRFITRRIESSYR